MGEVGAASPLGSRRVPSSAVPLPVRPIRPRHTRTRHTHTRLVHTQVTRIAGFERLQHDGTLSRRDLAKRGKWMAWGSSEIAARSPGMVVVGVVVAPTRARAFPFKYFQRRRSGMALVYPTEPPREIGDQREGRLWGIKTCSRCAKSERPLSVR